MSADPDAFALEVREIFLRAGWLPPDEAEKLRAEVERLNELYRVATGALPDQGPVSALMAERDKARADAEALAEALESYFDNPGSDTCDAALAVLARYRRGDHGISARYEVEE